MKYIKGLILISCVTFFTPTAFSNEKISSMECKKNAVSDAKKLLSFYRNDDDRIEIDDNIKPLSKIKNPQNHAQEFDVLETWGYIYKGKYRIRLTYYSSIDCTLMGEDILEYASL